MPKKFNIRDWVLSVKYWALLFVPHISILLIFLTYILIGASIFQEIEADGQETSSFIENQSRERLVSKLLEQRQLPDKEQFKKYMNNYIDQYEEELKQKSNDFSWNFSKALFFIVTTLTTTGSNELMPQTKLGKFLLMVYTCFGIPLTFIFLINLSFLTKRLIEYISLIVLHVYSTTYFLRRCQSIFSHENLIVHTDEDEEANENHTNSLRASSKLRQYIRDVFDKCKNYKNENHLTLRQLILTVLIYIIIGTYFISSKSFFDGFYICFMTIFTVNINSVNYQEHNIFILIIYFYFGFAIVLLLVMTIKIRLDRLIQHIANILLRNLLEFSQQIGSHDLCTDEFLCENEMNLYSMSDSMFCRNRSLSNRISLEQPSTVRPIGIAEPLRRFSTEFIRVFKGIDTTEQKCMNKSVQVSTTIRRCDRCAESRVPVLHPRKEINISSPSSSFADQSSSCDEDEIAELRRPNLERMRKRRATLVAKTIINQMATQPRMTPIEELIPPLSVKSRQKSRSSSTSPITVRCSVKVSRSPSLENLSIYESSDNEFSEISKKISSLLTAHNDEN